MIDETIKFTSEISATYINFLNVNIRLCGQQMLTQMFSKPTDTLLTYDSFHNPHIINAIPKGQYRRARRILSNNKQFQSSMRNITNKFLNRGYKKKKLAPLMEEVNQLDREELLQTKGQDKQYEGLFIQPPLFCYKRVVCCSSVMKSSTVNHPMKGTPIKIKNVFTCETKFVVYMLKCPCGMAYLGQTIRMVKERIKEHRNNIRNYKTNTATDTPVSRHFHNQGHNVSQFRWLVLEKITQTKRGGDVRKSLGQREAYWIKRMNTSAPAGLNDFWSLSPFL
ncbi:hypothetical protein XELAEV_18013250mg [Xenopus laevis]|uniref:GIY-YIG domain-containing protein n=1 Tax=Xenopus laevis TaxID=8355 RepID=A0A974DRR9_XENLA|nr:hypothetical protein XELAEV_18013250mg [Xenopus laevis]